MARTSDALTGVALMVVGLVLFVLWRNGTITRVLTPASEKYSDIANRTPSLSRLTAVDVIPNAGGAPRLAPAATAARAAGVPSNGFTPTGAVSGSTPLYYPPDFTTSVPGPNGTTVTRTGDPNSSSMTLAQDLTRLVTQIPDAYQVQLDRRINPFRSYPGAGRIN